MIHMIHKSTLISSKLVDEQRSLKNNLRRFNTNVIYKMGLCKASPE